MSRDVLITDRLEIEYYFCARLKDVTLEREGSMEKLIYKRNDSLEPTVWPKYTASRYHEIMNSSSIGGERIKFRSSATYLILVVS